jgi:uncharacterized membrane protein
MKITRLLGLDGRAGNIRFQKTITLAVPVERVFRFWTDFENLPRFMSRLREVRSTDDKRSHWVATGPAGAPIEWDADLTAFVPNQLLAWRSVPGR